MKSEIKEILKQCVDFIGINANTVNDYILNLEKENKALKEQLEIKQINENELYNKILDEVIEDARGYGLICDSTLFSLINDYDNKRIDYNYLLERLNYNSIIELKLALSDLRKITY